jgi:glycosyltransferase involved in cell wall biosynthesis
MRIVHAASGREWRGGQRQTWLLARELQRAGVEQLLVTKRDSELARRAKADGVPVREVSWSAGLDPRAWWALREEASGSSPWIATRRNAVPLRDPDGWKGARRVIAISGPVRQQLITDGIPEERIALVPSSIDIAATLAAPRVDLRGWAGLAPGGTIVATVAALTGEKGLETIAPALAVLRRTRDVRWVVVGAGPLRESFLAQAAAAGLSEVLRFPGYHNEPIRLLRDADLFAFPSRIEGLGTAVLDAMALSIPVVTTAQGGLADLLVDGGGVEVKVGDPESLAGGIASVIDDGELRARIIKAAQTTVDRHTVTRMAAKMRSVYDSVSANR